MSAPVVTEAQLEQYGCGPVRITGTANALYERHLMFDNIIDPAEVGPRERYEALENEAETWAALDLIFSDHFSRNEPGIFEPLRGSLLPQRARAGLRIVTTC